MARNSPLLTSGSRRWLWLAVVAGILVLGAFAGAQYFGATDSTTASRPLSPPPASSAHRDPVDAAPPMQTQRLILPETPEAGDPPNLAYEEVPPEPIYESAPVLVPPPVLSLPSPADMAPQVTPQPSTADLATWQKNAVAVPALSNTPQIAIVIDDAGVDQRRTRRAVALPGPLTLAFLPYARNVPAQAKAARSAGHELIVHLPMEPENPDVDPGPRVLKADATPEDLRAVIDWALSQFEGYVGLNNHMGSKFTANTHAMGVLMGELSRRGLLFLDSRTARQTVGAAQARSHGVPVAERNVFLDHVPNVETVRKQLNQLERVARKQGYAVAIGHPRDATLQVLEEWLPEVAGKGFALVPISAIVLRKIDQELAAGNR